MTDSRRPCVAISVPVRDLVHVDTYRSIMALDVPRPFHTLDVRDHPVEIARNEIVGRAFAVNDAAKADPSIPRITHLLWIDDDMVFKPDALQRLLAHDLPIVGGLCHNRRAPYMPILLYKSPASGSEANHAYLYRYDYPKGLVEVDATGGAFLLVKMEVFEAIEQKFATPGEGPFSQRGSGEDVSFCERAKLCGYPIYVDTTVEIGHIGEVIVEPEFARRNRSAEFNPWIPPAELAQAPGQPRATIIIPAYNEPPELLRAAVQSALAQTVPVEIIVVDNGSTGCPWCGMPWWSSETPECTNPACPGVPTHPHLKVIRLPENSGSPWPAVNAGIRTMSTDYAALLSADDMFYPKKVERQMRSMRATGALASFHGYDVKTPDGQSTIVPVMVWRTMEEQQRILAHGCLINMLTVMLHRSVIERVGLFDESITIASDWEFWNRVGREFFWHPMLDVLATRRERADNCSAKYAADPAKRERWLTEDNEIRQRYAPRCKHCGELS